MSNALSGLVRADLEDGAPLQLRDAVGALCRAGGFRRRERIRPRRLVQLVMERTPEVLDKLDERQRESLNSMMLSAVIGTSTQWSGGGRVIDGRRLVAEWELLSDAVKRALPEQTEQAVRSLAEHAEQTELAVRPSELAAALLADGHTRKALCNGGLHQ